MPTASLAHAALSAAAVGVLLTTLRRAGPRASGLAAAVPINSIPALFWLSLEHGGAFATSAVLGTLWGTGLAVLLGASFARLALAMHAVRAALLAWIAIVAVAVLTWRLPMLPAAAALLAICAVVFGRAALPRVTGSEATGRARKRDGTLLSMTIAGAMSLLVTELSRHSGPQFCGLVAALPLVGMFATCAGYREGGTPLMLRVLGGYLDGMAAKAAFLAGLGAAWSLGAEPWAWGIALAAAGLTLLAQQRLQRQEARRSCLAGAAFDTGSMR
jgi:hypothetical protein